MDKQNFSNMSGPQLGKIQNHLGLLTEDKEGHQGFNPAKFMKITGLSALGASKVTEASRPSMYKDFIILKPSTRLRERVYSLVTATDLAYDLFNKSKEDTINWMMSANSLLFGSSPFEVCMRGDGQPLIEWLLERSGQVPLVKRA